MTSDLETTTLLVVEDEQSVRSAITRYLTRLGYRVLDAEDGVSATEVLRGHPEIEVMVSDIQMPRMNGIQLIPEALAIDPGLVILMLTAVDEAATAAQCVSLGALAYLVKPVEGAVLGAHVERALARRRGENDPQSAVEILPDTDS